MGYPPPPPPPGAPGGYGPPSGYGPPPGGAPPPGGGYGGPPPPGGGYGPPTGPPPGGPSPSGSSKGPLIALMAALVVVVLLAVVGGVVLALRGGDDEVELTEAQRTDALLTEGDVGEGFSEEPIDDEDDSSDDYQSSRECEELLDRQEEEGTELLGTDAPPGAVQRKFGDESGASIEHGLAPSIDLVDTYRELVGTCDEVTVEEEGVPTVLRFSEGEAQDVGDDSVTIDIGFTVTDPETGEEFDFEGSVIAWTRDGTDVILSIGPGFDAESGQAVPVDQALIDDLVAKADERLAEVIDEA